MVTSAIGPATPNIGIRRFTRRTLPVISRRSTLMISPSTRLSVTKKKKLFDARKRVQESMHRYLNSMQTVLTIPISKGIVKVIIGDMFFKPELDEDDEEMELITKTNALKLFQAAG
ncbi:unnamed protein product [Sphagnum balticum]